MHVATPRLVTLAATLVALTVATPAPAGAVTLTLQSESTPWPGVTWRKYRTASPATNMWVALVDLCANRVHVEATKTSSALKTTGAFASGIGAQLATNGDFFRAGPVRVYGDAIGNGSRWPLIQTGLDDAYQSEWYYDHYGWIAFGPDWVDFTHTGYVKEHASPSTGWRPGELLPDARPGTLALVSGFPELVVDGATVTCTSPTASRCPRRR